MDTEACLELVRAYQAGDADAGNQLVQLHGRFIRSLVSRLRTTPLLDLDDLAQEAGLVVLTCAAKYNFGPVPWAGYVSMCVMRRLRRIVHQSAAHESHFTRWADTLDPDGYNQWVEHLVGVTDDQFGLAHEIAELCDYLPEFHRRVLFLRFGLDGNPPHTLLELCEALGVGRNRATLYLEQATQAIVYLMTTQQQPELQAA